MVQVFESGFVANTTLRVTGVPIRLVQFRWDWEDRDVLMLGFVHLRMLTFNTASLIWRLAFYRNGVVEDKGRASFSRAVGSSTALLGVSLTAHAVMRVLRGDEVSLRVDSLAQDTLLAEDMRGRVVVVS